METYTRLGSGETTTTATAGVGQLQHGPDVFQLTGVINQSPGDNRQG